MKAARGRDLHLAAEVAAGLIAATAVISAGVHFLGAAWTRRLLGFGFEGVPHTLGTAGGIFLANVRVLGAVLASCLAVQVGRKVGVSPSTKALAGLIVAVCDGALIVLCAVHVVMVGAAFGAYGPRIIGSTLLHGPFEVAGFSVGLALYLAGRRERLSGRRFATTALTAVGLLAVAAALETFTRA
jgi:hypothetical protein